LIEASVSVMTGALLEELLAVRAARGPCALLTVAATKAQRRAPLARRRSSLWMA